MSAADDLDQLRALTTPLIVYVGAELSQAAGLPSRRDLARLLLHTLPDETPQRRRRELATLCEGPDLADAFTEFERELGSARMGREIEPLLRDDDLEPPALARVLAGLGKRVQGIVTPNLDRLLERAFASRLVLHTRPSVGLLQQDGWLLKLNGTLHERDSWVLTREQRARVRRDPAHVEVLRALFIGKPMLFVGVTLDDSIFDDAVAHVRDLADGAPPRHWALVRRDRLTMSTRTKLDDAGIAAIPYTDEIELLEWLVSLAQPPGEPAAALSRPRSGPMRILFASAVPPELEPLGVDRELRIIRESIARAERRDMLELHVRTATSFADLSRALLEHSYDIVHLASHGEPGGVLLDDAGPLQVPPRELAALFDEYAAPSGPLRCVVLNACWSRQASEPIAKVPTVIAMDGTIDDRAALAYAEGFYDALGTGRDFATAHREGQRRARTLVPHGAFEVHLITRGQVG